MRRTLVLRVGVVFAAAATAALGFAVPASAHVTITPDAAVQGGDATVAFQVPNEKDTANTTKLEVTLPADQPIASVAVKPIAGWTTATETTKLATPIKSDSGDVTEAITKITWIADAAAAIKPGQFQAFEVSLGPLPNVDQIVFKVLQTYSDGAIVRWIDMPPAAGAAEPDHPAPVLKLAKASVSGDQPAGTTTSGANATASTSAAKSSSNGVAVGLGVAGLVLGLAGLVVGLLAYRKASIPTPTP
jgi:uncharacterized protein YcnI